MIVIGIDTSCDDTGVGVVRDGVVLANVVAAQTSLHAAYGGVMPEQASREHLETIDAVLERALREAGVTLAEVDAVAATHGPGLVGALLVGLMYAKALAWSRGLPFVPVHHLEGHIASSLAGDGAGAGGSAGAPGGVEVPFLCLIASGGHTSLFVVRSWGDVEELGRTRDDAAGEAFDKVARLLGLPYPGGPALAALAERGDAEAVPLPEPLKRQEGFDFSFSGLKTAVATLLEREPDVRPEDVAASFERTVVESLVATAARAAEARGLSRLVVAGGVAANARLRSRLAETGLEVRVPPLALATDNGAMIALAAERRLAGGAPPPAGAFEVDASPYLPLAAPRSASS